MKVFKPGRVSSGDMATVATGRQHSWWSQPLHLDTKISAAGSVRRPGTRRTPVRSYIFDIMKRSQHTKRCFWWPAALLIAAGASFGQQPPPPVQGTPAAGRGGLPELRSALRMAVRRIQQTELWKPGRSAALAIPPHMATVPARDGQAPMANKRVTQ